MALLEILSAPDPRLKKKANPVGQVADRHRRLMDDMLETMYDAPGIGLAAPQVGVSERIIVIDLAREGEQRDPLKMVNPTIIACSENTVLSEEGCLSVPDQYAEVKRPDHVTVRYLDENGEEHEMEADGLMATCIQHEIDHLDGVLFIDYLSRMKRAMIVKKVQKLVKERA